MDSAVGGSSWFSTKTETFCTTCAVGKPFTKTRMVRMYWFTPSKSGKAELGPEPPVRSLTWPLHTSTQKSAWFATVVWLKGAPGLLAFWHRAHVYWAAWKTLRIWNCTW